MPEATSADIATCESEPIRIPGAVQPHGFLLSLDLSDVPDAADASAARVVQVSDNLADFIGMAPGAAPGVPLDN